MHQKKAQGWRKHIDFILWDILCLQFALFLAYVTRHGLASPYVNKLYFNMALVYVAIDFLVLVVNSTMSKVLKRGYYKEALCTVKHVVLVVLLSSLFLFSVQYAEDYSRITFYLTTGYYLVISYIVRIVWKQYLKRNKNIVNKSAAYIVTTSVQAEKVVERFVEENSREYVLKGLCFLDKDGRGEDVCGYPVEADKEGLLKFLCDKWVDEVFLALPYGGEDAEKLINNLTDMGIVVHVYLEDIVTEDWKHQTVERIGESVVRTFSIASATEQELMLKRMLDILGGLVGCLFTLLLALVIGPVIYIKSPGPIFFTQTRVGKNGRKFKIYKFRSMYMDAEARKAELMAQNRLQSDLMFKLEFDPRIIGCEKRPDGSIKKGIGNFIRDYSIDEFPQFWNVLKGDLSLCGTRPPTVDEWEKYELHHRARLAIKPGITGMWQTSGRSNITDFEQVVELDKKYIREWSMGLDFRILLKTVLVVFGKDGSM